jgi:hypothetical protein
MTDTVADPKHVKIAGLRRLAAEPKARPEAVHRDTGGDGANPAHAADPAPEAQNRIGPGEQQ